MAKSRSKIKSYLNSCATIAFGVMLLAGVFLPLMDELESSNRIHKLQTLGLQLEADVTRTTVYSSSKSQDYSIEVKYQVAGRTQEVKLYSNSVEIYNKATHTEKILITYLPEEPEVSEITTELTSSEEQEGAWFSWILVPVAGVVLFGEFIGIIISLYIIYIGFAGFFKKKKNRKKEREE